MVIGISKRHQFRNERTLQDLIRTVPGNDRCADCHTANPSWTSWNLGVFLCMRCAALHRKLGTHISKVKSLSMDSWTSEQVDSMRSHGNTIVNQIYNPKNVKPPIPTDVDEADSCMERFIRQKYQYRSLVDGKPKPPSRHGSEGNVSPEGSPPPLPPKTGGIFSGLRSASSTSNLRRPSSNKGSGLFSGRRASLSPQNTSQGTGASVAEIGTVSFASKLTTLRDMGFPDDRRNAVVLKGLGGDLEKTVDSLVRLGEGSHPGSRSRTPAPPLTSTSTGNAARQEQKASTNPFDQLDTKPQNQPNGTPYNPFDMPTPQSAILPSQSLESSFQNLQVSQPLFPHSTGGYPPQHSLSQPLPQYSATPPVTSTFNQGSFVSSPQAMMDGSYNPFFQGSQPQYGTSFVQNPTTQNNPFFNRISPQSTMQQGQQPMSTSAPSFAIPNPPRHANTMPAFSSTPAFGQAFPFQPQQPQQPQGSHNPFFAMTVPNTPQAAVYENQFQQSTFQAPQQLVPQPTGRMDKNSILSLYNFSPPPPAISEQPQPQQVPGLSASLNSTPQSQSASTPQGTQPPTGSRNPFMTAPGSQPDQSQSQGFGMGMAPKAPTRFPRTHMSQPSVDISNLQNGRHSPDAFASLSARYG